MNSTDPPQSHAVSRTTVQDSPSATHAPATEPTGTPRRVGPYHLLSPLGKGAFGEVWLAERESSIAKNRLAVKIPLADRVDLEAIRREAEVWIRVGSHPNVLPLFEADEYDGVVAIVSEYAPDGSLQGWIERHGGKAPTIESAIDMVMAILSGLEHLHVRAVIHRDLKPANILMQGESPRIADFGLARLLDPAASSVAAGTPLYMAPESFDGERSAKTDLWSAGVILYQLLSGTYPFPAGDYMRLVKAIATRLPAPLGDSIPAAIREAVLTSLAKEPAERFRSAAEMRGALRDALRDSRSGSADVTTRGCRSIAVTGSMYADRRATRERVRELLSPFCDERTTWYCGSVGAADESAAEFLLERGQRVIVVGYHSGDLSVGMCDLLDRYGSPFVDAMDQRVPSDADAPSQRDIFFSTKADLVVVLWDGRSTGAAKLLDWLRKVKKDHILGFV